MAKTSLLLKLKTKPTSQASPISEGQAAQPSPVVKEPSPILPVPPLSSKPSLKDRLKAKSMGAADRRQQPSLVGEMKAETGLDRAKGEAPSPTPTPAAPVPAVVSVAPSKPSLIDKLRLQIAEKATQSKPLQKAQTEPEAVPTPPAAITPTSQPLPSSPDIEAEEVSYAGHSITLAEKIALAKRAELVIEESFEPSPLSPESDLIDLVDRAGRPITLNDKQRSGCQMAIDGKDYVLTGEAGTGKSTTIEAVIASLLKHHRDKIKDTDYRAQDRSGRRITGPSIAVVSYTRKAIGNVARILSHNFELYAEMEGALQTVHNLLEYSPVVVWSEKQEKEVQMFKPSRGKWNQLDVTHLIIEEASMLGLDLWAELREALKPGVQIIYVGDINQLPPVFGKSVMSYALTKLPIVHLDTVYRQALDNPIIANAHAVLHGQAVEEAPPAVKWIQGKQKMAVPEETMSRAMGEFFRIGIENKERVVRWREERDAWDTLSLEDRQVMDKPKSYAEIEANERDHLAYDPDEDIVLIPFNKNAMGTRQINYRIAQLLGERRNAEVFEILAGFEKHYLAIDDHVLVNKMEGKITNIRSNMQYMGRKPMSPSVNLSRFGFYSGSSHVDQILNGDDLDISNLDLDIDADIDENEERRQQSSHIVTCELEDGREAVLSSAGEFNSQIFQLGYALSVHKAQGSEWKRVFLLFHKNHATMMSRELLYTAMTRAREELVIVSRPELIKKAIANPRIKGNSLKEKLEYFNSGYLDEDVEVSV